MLFEGKTGLVAQGRIDCRKQCLLSMLLDCAIVDCKGAVLDCEV